jgi:hypothetical protein
MIRSLRSLCLPLLLLTTGCARMAVAAAPAPSPPPVAGARAEALPSVERRLVQRASVRIIVEDPAALAPEAQSVAERMGGYVESAVAEERRLTVAVRVPSPQLSAFLDTVERWGEVRERRVTSEDVTEQAVDLEARVRNLTAVRDRLRAYLARAGEIQDIIAVERELARVQSELEGLESRLTRLQTEVALSRVTLELERRRVLGPLGALVAGTAWVISRLFIIR